MDKNLIRQKFGNDYIADEMTYKMGIDVRLTDHLSSRFKNCCVLETCTGGGFSTISLAKYADHVYSFEVDGERLKNSIKNAELAQIADKVTFINDDVFNVTKYDFSGKIDAAFLDPDWAVSDTNHVYRFIESNTIPPSDLLFDLAYGLTHNVTLIQPPFVPTAEFRNLPAFELECLYIDADLQLYCLHFGSLKRNAGDSRFGV